MGCRMPTPLCPQPSMGSARPVTASTAGCHHPHLPTGWEGARSIPPPTEGTAEPSTSPGPQAKLPGSPEGSRAAPWPCPQEPGAGAKAASPAPLTLAPCPVLTQPCAQHRAAGSGQNPHRCSSPCSACSPAPRHCITSCPAAPPHPVLAHALPLHKHCAHTAPHVARSPHHSPQPPCYPGPAPFPIRPRPFSSGPAPSRALLPARPVPTCPSRAGPSHPFGSALCSRVPLCPLLGARRGPDLGAAQPPAPGPTAITIAVCGGRSPPGAA